MTLNPAQVPLGMSLWGLSCPAGALLPRSGSQEVGETLCGRCSTTFGWLLPIWSLCGVLMLIHAHSAFAYWEMASLRLSLGSCGLSSLCLHAAMGGCSAHRLQMHPLASVLFSFAVNHEGVVQKTVSILKHFKICSSLSQCLCGYVQTMF